MEVTLSLSRSAVFNEVARSSSYTGAKMPGDADAYARIPTVDEDEDELCRFWDESRAEVCRAFIRMLVSEGMCGDGDTYRVVLNVSRSFDMALLPGMELGLFSYFVKRIISKWYVYVNKSEAVGYAESSRNLLEEIKEKAYYKKKPVRPTY